jgi:predicted nuclease with TOPRIM domain
MRVRARLLTAPLVAASLVALAPARGQRYDGRDRLAEQRQRFAEEQAKTKQILEKLKADDARYAAERAGRLKADRAEVARLAGVVDAKRAEVKQLADTLEAKRAELERAVVEHALARSRLPAEAPTKD